MHAIDGSFGWTKVTEEGEEEEGPPRGKTRPTVRGCRAAASSGLCPASPSAAQPGLGNLAVSFIFQQTSFIALPQHHTACTPMLPNEQQRIPVEYLRQRGLINAPGRKS